MARATWMGIAFLMLMLAQVDQSIDAADLESTVQGSTSWTVMIYMAADTSASLPWLEDINEMEAAAQHDGTNVIVLLDTLGAPDSRLLRIVHDPNGLESTIVSPEIDDGGAVITAGEVNTGDPSTLSRFIEFCASSYPADKLVLILWGHGSGWRGLCPDGTDLLTLPEVRTALSDAHSSISRMLDIVTVDACAQGSFEMLYQVTGHADFFVASEKDVPYDGLPYTAILDALALDVDQSAEEFSTAIVEEYHRWCSINSIYATTMAAYKLSEFDRLDGLMSTICATGVAYMRLFHDTMQDSLSLAEYYEDRWHIDFGNMMELMLRSDLPLEIRHLALATLQEYSRFVSYFRLYSYQDPYDGVFANHSTGAVIYAASSNLADADYVDLEIASTSWFTFSKMLRESIGVSQGAPGPAASYSDADLDGRNDSVTLSWPSTHSQHMVWAFRNTSHGIELGQVIATPGTDVILDLPGNWVLSASAWDSGEVVGYAVINTTLFGSTEIFVSIVGADEGTYSVTVCGPNGNVTAELAGTTGSVAIDVPDFAEVGDVLTVKVTGSDDDDLVGETKLFLSSSQTDAVIPVHESHDEGPDLAVPLILALLPGTLIFMFAVMLAWDDRRKKRNSA